MKKFLKVLICSLFLLLVLSGKMGIDPWPVVFIMFGSVLSYSIGSLITTLILKDAVPESQEPKYGVGLYGVYNRKSGEYIPPDEPIFIIRAKDRLAHTVLHQYANSTMVVGSNISSTHRDAVLRRCNDFSEFARNNPSRMNDPTT